MSEGQQVHIADEQVEGAGEEREAKRLHDEEGIGDKGGDGDERDHHEKGDEIRATIALARVGLEGGGFEALGHDARPNRPEGRHSSTMAMMTKTTVFDASG